MKKIIFSAVLVTAALITSNSCVKKTVSPGSVQSVQQTSGQEKLVCNLSNIYQTSYSALGNDLCGSGNGIGTYGAIDTYLNCNIVEGPGCNLVNPQGVFTKSYSSDPIEGTFVLNDGMMSISEQQSLITQIQNTCLAHKNAHYGAAYTISKYDCSFGTLLCNGCPDKIYISVSYKAITTCKN